MGMLASWADTQRFHASVLAWGTAAQDREPEVVEGARVKERLRELTARRSRFPSFNIRPLAYFPVNALYHLVDWGLLAAISLVLVLFGLQFPHPREWDKLWLVLHLRELGDPIIARVAAWASSEWPDSSTSYLPLGLALGGWIIRSVLYVVFLPILAFLRRCPSSGKQVQEPLEFYDESTMAVCIDSERAQELLLKRYREIHSALRAAERKRCAFLSIDIAGSTHMKESERELAVTITFRAYMEMLEEIFDQYGAWKQSWTPDGVMVCFLHRDLAVAAAQTVLRRLRIFNRTENQLRTRISVRCGVNEGELPIFEDSKLEKIAHQVIDVTGHMQKHANTDTLWLSAEVYNDLEDKSGFRPTGKEVDGHLAYEWSPSLTSPGPRPSAPDPQGTLRYFHPMWFFSGRQS